MLQVLQAACDLLPSSALKSSSLSPDLQEAVEACRHRGQVQKRVLDREVAKFVAAEDARKGQAMGALFPDSVVNQPVQGSGTMPVVDSKKGLQRGPVGCDGVG